jgi:hypothetical protein
LVPREKRSRHSKKHNRRAKAIAPSPGDIYEVSDLRQCFYCRNFIPKSKSLTDCICDGFISPESVLDVPGRPVLIPPDILKSVTLRAVFSDNTDPGQIASPHPHPHLLFFFFLTLANLLQTPTYKNAGATV